jgi:hypothetical protein
MPGGQGPGTAGVKIGAVALGVFETRQEALRLTEHGRAWFLGMGINTDALASSRRSFCRPCLDWSERRHHLAGALGAAVLARIQELGWAKRARDSRAIVFSNRGGEVSLLATLTSRSASTGPMPSSSGE